MAALTANSRHLTNRIVRDHVLYYSYETCIGVKPPKCSLMLTTQKFSATTNRHIRKLDYEIGGVMVDPIYFSSYVHTYCGQDIKTTR